MARVRDGLDVRLYYDHGDVKIYHGDACEAGHLPAELSEADVILTDPPWGMNIQKGRAPDLTQKSQLMPGDFSVTYDDSPEYVREYVIPSLMGMIQAVGRAAVLPGTKHLDLYLRLAYPAAFGSILHPVGPQRSSWGFQHSSPVLYYGKDPQEVASPNSVVITKRAVGDTFRVHPTTKPLSWMNWLVGRASKPKETVLDPFCGVGTTLLAAKNLGRKAIGIEIEERYCELASERLQQEVMAL